MNITKKRMKSQKMKNIRNEDKENAILKNAIISDEDLTESVSGGVNYDGVSNTKPYRVIEVD